MKYFGGLLSRVLSNLRLQWPNGRSWQDKVSTHTNFTHWKSCKWHHLAFQSASQHSTAPCKVKQSASLCNSWYVSSREKSSIRSGKITKNTQIISNTVCLCVPYLIFLKQSVDIREGSVGDAGVTKAFSTRKLLPTQRLDKREGPLNTEDLNWKPTTQTSAECYFKLLVS